MQPNQCLVPRPRPHVCLATANPGLTGVTTSVAAEAAVHQSIDDHGVMKMRPVGPLPIEPGKPVTFAAGGRRASPHARSVATEAVLGTLVVLTAGFLASHAPGTHEQPVWPFAWRLSVSAFYAELSTVRKHKSLVNNDNLEFLPDATGYNTKSNSSNALRWTSVGRVSTVIGKFGATAVMIVLRASVARSASRVWKLCTGNPSGVTPVVCF
jgi:Copper chaperone PCu(A)C